MPAVEIIVFYLLLFLIFALEGLGLPGGRQITFYLILLSPLLLFRQGIYAPKKLSFLFFIFFTLSLISVIFSVNVQKSFEAIILNLASFLILIYAYNHQEILLKSLPKFIFGMSIVFIGYFMFQDFLPVPNNGYQFVFSRFLSHNHLADFLLLPLVILFSYLLSNRTKKSKLSIVICQLSIVFFLPYFIFSYSRSAYLDIALVVVFIIIYRIRKKMLPSPISLIAIALTVAFSLVLFFATAKDIKKEGIFSSTQEFLSRKYGFEGKEFFASRDQYINESFLSIVNAPLAGIGPGNFYYASIKYTNAPSEWTETAHNIFLDIFVENGILAGIIFVLIIINILKRSQKGVFFFLFVAMLLNFQTDYTHRIYSFFTLFLILAGMVYEEKETIKLKKPLLVVSLFVFLFASAIFLSNIANKPSTKLVLGKSSKQILAFYLYPLNKDVYKPLIEYSFLKKDKEEENFLLTLYSNFFRGDPEVLNYLGGVYERKGDKIIALKYYERAFEANPLRDWNTVWTIYNLKEDLVGDKEAKAFADRLFKRVEGVREKWSIDEDFRIETMKLCQKLYNLHCPYDL